MQVYARELEAPLGFAGSAFLGARVAHVSESSFALLGSGGGGRKIFSDLADWISMSPAISCLLSLSLFLLLKKTLSCWIKADCDSVTHGSSEDAQLVRSKLISSIFLSLACFRTSGRGGVVQVKDE